MPLSIFTVNQMRTAEQLADQQGLTFLRMMENAGAAVARRVEALANEQKIQTVCVLCGSGNNGGDGMVAARLLSSRGFAVSVLLLCGAPATVTAAQVRESLRPCRVPVVDVKTQNDYARRLVQESGLVVDSVFGAGFHGELPPVVREFFGLVRQCRLPVVAVDVPSGMCADTGEAENDTLPCKATVTFHGYRYAHVIQPARALCGSITVADIGLPAPKEPLPFVTDDTVYGLLPPRPADGAHKGLFGTASLIVGSYGMAGAAALSAGGCMAAGAGLTRVILPHGVYPLVAAGVPEAVFAPYDPEEPLQALANAGGTACLFGCGVGCTPAMTKLGLELLKTVPVPLVLDADGINCLCGHIDAIRERTGTTVLTPHPGEFARLTGRLPAEEERIPAALSLAKELNALVVLKGAGTVIAHPDGRFAVNYSGNSGLAKGGSGDVLAGMITGFLAQGADPMAACAAAVYFHGKAGERASLELSRRAMQPSHLLQALPALFLEQEKKQV